MRLCALAFMSFACVSGTALAAKPKVLGTCQLGAEARQLVTVLAKDPVYGRDTVYLRLGRNAAELPLFADEEIEESRGRAVVVQCAGDRENVLVIFGEIGSSNYLRGQLIRYYGGRFQRLHFAEQDSPSRVYLDGDDMLLYIQQPYPGREPPWIVYRYDGNTGEEQQISATELPTGRRYVEIKLR